MLYNECWIKEQEMLELMTIEQMEKSNAEENEKWVRAEKIAVELWQILQERMRILQQEKVEKEAKMKLVSSLSIYAIVYTLGK